LIELKNISKKVVKADVNAPILRNIDLCITKGEFLSIMGPSASGKSTLMNILGILDVPSSGEYIFEGTNIISLNSRRLADFRNRKIGFIFQSFMLIPRLSVEENVEVPLLYSKWSQAERRKRIEMALEQVGMTHKAKDLIVNLSGGQKQKIAIARAIINEPELLLADEPTGNLDSESKGEILQIFQSLNGRGKTIVLVTHDQEVGQIGKRILTLKDGVWAKTDPSSSKVGAMV
jgi:putative ABC transport system ATP-binding protein